MVNKKAVNVQGKSLQHFQKAQRTAAQDYFENITKVWLLFSQ